MKKLLFVYPELMLGGSTTSLLSLLNSIDYNKYKVDLMLYKNQGEYFNDLPPQVNVLEESSLFHNDSIFSKYKKIIKFGFSGNLLKAFFYELFYKKRIGFNPQVVSNFYAQNSRELNEHYDVAIGYLELWADYYCLQKVDASKKIIWIHIDYLNTGFISTIDAKLFEKADKIVCVSDSCLVNFNNKFPSLSHKSIVFENILSDQFIMKKAEEKIDSHDLQQFSGVKLVTVCRLSIHTKGLDRAVHAAAKLKEEGYHFKWFIIGDGEDRELLQEMIEIENIQDTLILLGKKRNPYPYIKQCDVFVMASRREGKPMAVTEAQILGLPIIVTNYASATEQVINGQDGFVVTNKDNAIYDGIKSILDDPIILQKFKNNLLQRQLSTEALIKDFYTIIE